MINTQIVEYIRGQLQAGVELGKIRSDLLTNGWTDGDIAEAVASITQVNAPQTRQAFPVQRSSKVVPITVTVIILLLLAGGSLFAFNAYRDYSIAKTNKLEAQKNQDQNTKTLIADAVEKNRNSDTVSNFPATTTNSPSVPNSTTESDDLWSVYDKMTVALKNKDIPAFNSVSYVQVLPDQVAQFSMMASFLFEMTQKTVKSNYVNKWKDGKQAIYSTNPQKSDDASVYGYTQGSLMFINIDGSWKILSDSPDRGWSVLKSGTNRTAAQVEQDLQAMMLDSDMDGLKDEEETCTGANKYDLSV